MIVVDANVAVMALAGPAAAADAARAAMFPDEVWIAAHMPLEILRTSRKTVFGADLSADDAEAAFQGLIAIQIESVASPARHLRRPTPPRRRTGHARYLGYPALTSVSLSSWRLAVHSVSPVLVTRPTGSSNEVQETA